MRATPGRHDAVVRLARASSYQLVAPGDAVEQRHHEGEERRRREAVGRRADGPGPARRQAAAGRSARAAPPSRRRSPGTGALRTSPRNGISRWPSARRRSGSAPEPARPDAFSTAGGPVPVVHEGEQVAAHAAHVRRGDGQRGAGGDGGVDGVAAGPQHARRRPRRPAGRPSTPSRSAPVRVARGTSGLGGHRSGTVRRQPMVDWRHALPRRARRRPGARSSGRPTSSPTPR